MSPHKQRKSLNDNEALDFVFGESKAPPNSTKNTLPTKRKSEKEPIPKESMSDIMDELLNKPEKEATVRITVDLPQSLHRKLSIFAATSGHSKAHIIRTLLEPLLEQVNE